MSIEIRENHFCNHCKKETIHIAREDTLEIEYECTECHKKEDLIKTFF